MPVDETFRRVIGILKEGREAEYGYLGVRRPSYAPQAPADGRPGIRVQDVVSGTPAQRAGLRPGDVILRVGDVPIHDFDSLVLEVGKLPIEAVARLRVLRDGRQFDLRVRLTKYPVRGRKIVTTRPDLWRGMQVDYPTAVVDSNGRPVFPAIAFDQGVAVVEVQEGTMAWQAGLRSGMLVRQVGRKPIHNPAEFRNAVAGLTGPVNLHLADDPDNPVRTVGPGL
jgi:serine protease Do